MPRAARERYHCPALGPDLELLAWREDNAHGSSTSSGLVMAAHEYAASGAASYTLRSPEQLTRFFAGLELVPPGVSPTPRWRPDVGPPPETEVYSNCAVGRKP